MKLLSLAACCLLAASFPCLAQTACKGGTGSNITSVSTTAAPICLAPVALSTGIAADRTELNVPNAGGANMDCTWDGTTPTSSYWDFRIPPGGQFIATFVGWVPLGQITCLCESGTCPTKPSASQGSQP